MRTVSLTVNTRGFCFRFFLALIFLFFSCTRSSSTADDIVIPPTPPLSRDVIGYGVISTNYTHVLDKQGQDGKSLGFLRKGSIVEIIERRPIVINEKAENWVFAKGSYSGWLREDDLRIYSSKAKAKTAAQTLPQ
ncbi:MAG: hypothetical protein Ta2F_10630 [Termitinemataceae bacterium]|nr:MAG: hypothetical protein Ta2F_10630 [Termitinemataceae bacterium]